MATTLFTTGKNVFSLSSNGELTHLFCGKFVINFTFNRKFTRDELMAHFPEFKLLLRGGTYENIEH